LYITALVLLLFLRPGSCQEAPADASTPGPVEARVLEAKITETEAAAGMEEEAKARLVELYRKALGNLKEATSNTETAKEFRRAAETAPARIQALREEIAASASSPVDESLAVEPSIPSGEIERLLRQEKSELAAEDARRLDLEKRLEEAKNRPEMIRQRLSEARDQREEISAQLELSVRSDEGPVTAEARRWALETGLDKLSAEIEMLDQELRTHPARVELMQFKRNRAEANVRRMAQRIETLEGLVSRKRREEAEQAAVEAEETARRPAGGPCRGQASRPTARRWARGAACRQR
jgi:potassium efflux system protein